MKRLNGGEYLLDLTPITIAESVDGETYTNISNQNVIKQLTNLKEFIRNPKAIKPVWVKFVNDEDNAVIVTRGSLSIVDDGEFDIDVAINGYTLKIHVEFTQATLSDSTPIDDWYIDTNDAKYLFTSDAQNISPIAEDVAKDVIESAESGTIADVLGLDANGGLVKDTISSGTKLYKHQVEFQFEPISGIFSTFCLIEIINDISTPYILQSIIDNYSNLKIDYRGNVRPTLGNVMLTAVYKSSNTIKGTQVDIAGDGAITFTQRDITNAEDTVTEL